MMKRIALAALLITGTAHAQAPSLGEIAMAAGGGIVGGGRFATIEGSGDDLVIRYSQPGAGLGGPDLSRVGRSTRFAGSDGDGPTFEATTPAPAGVGREAWLSGSGDEARVTYVRPR